MSKKITLVFFCILIIFTITTKVYSSSFNFNVQSNTKYLKPGETVVITMKVSNIDIEQPGINTLEAFLEYDENVFEKVTRRKFYKSKHLGYNI